MSRLGIDVGELAGKLRMQAAQADAANERSASTKHGAYAAEVEALERRRLSPPNPETSSSPCSERSLQGASATGGCSLPQKYESATDEELAELIRALRHLLGEDEPE